MMGVLRIKLVLVILITMLVAQATIVFATASSRPQWAREGVYFIYGVVGFGDKPIYDEELESTINKWRFADIREFGWNYVEIKFVKVDEEKAIYTIASYGRLVTPGTYTQECRWDSGRCVELGLFYMYSDPRTIEGFKSETREDCRDNQCTINIREIRDTTFVSRFGELEIYELVVKYVSVHKYPDKTEKLGEVAFISRVHKPTGIVIELVYLEQRICPLNKTCWIGGLLLLLDTNVPLGARSPSPTQTTPQASPTPVQTPVTFTPTQVETVKTPSPATPTQQPTIPDQLSGMVLPIVVAVAGIVAVVAVFKILRK